MKSRLKPRGRESLGGGPRKAGECWGLESTALSVSQLSLPFQFGFYVGGI